MSSTSGAVKLENLRKLMKSISFGNIKGIHAYLVQTDDAHQSEYIRDRDKRREYISGFSGSFGTAVVTLDKALLWTDGRYFSQASAELDPPDAWILMKEGVVGTPSIESWLSNNLPAHSVVGADPNLLSNSSWIRLQNALTTAEITLQPIENNLIDQLWSADRPKDVLNKILPHTLKYSGRSAGCKIEQCFKEMKKCNTSVLILTALDDIAYVLNWRGSDIPYNPVFFAYVILFEDQVHIFVNDARLSLEARTQLTEEKVKYTIHPYENVSIFLKNIDFNNGKNKVWISNNSSHALHSICNAAVVQTTITPVSLMKLIKNESEITGMKTAHIRDAVALVKYYSWLEHEIVNLANSTITEISGAQQLETFRKELDNYIGPSFSTISAVGKNAAIIHYSSTPKTDVPINNTEFYLCDAGAQFLDGTTDVTRTLHFGEPSDFEKECFTRVFKGQCNLAMSKFPMMIKGNYLDTIARKHLWDVGLDYLHGTGHGVGSYLNVHEYPTMISWKPYPDDPGLQPGMFLSNEPGYYEEGKFGIRLENIEMVTKTKTKYDRLNRNFLTFDTVTLVPIQTRCLNVSMLSDSEIDFLNQYHKKCYEILSPYLIGQDNERALQWLKKETQAIQR